MNALKTMAQKSNLTIILTIHQPSARVFQTINKLIFLSAGHATFYDDATKLQAYAESLYTKFDIVSAGGNAPELFLDICDQLTETGEVEKLFKEDLGTAISLNTKTSLPDTTSVYANTFLKEMMILSHRAFINVVRTPELFVARFILIFVGFQMGTLFLFSANTATGLNYRAAFFTFTLATFYWTSLEALPIFFQEREIFMREFSRGAYRGISYTLATWLVSLPALIILGTFYALMTWWLVGLPEDGGRFFFFAFQCFMALLVGQTFATMISTLVPDPMTGQTIGSTTFAVMLVFSGYFITRDAMPKYWFVMFYLYFHFTQFYIYKVDLLTISLFCCRVWLNYLSLFKWMLDSMLINAFSDGNATTQDETNEQVLAHYSLQDQSRGVGVAVIAAFAIFFRIVFYTRLVTGFTGTRKG